MKYKKGDKRIVFKPDNIPPGICWPSMMDKYIGKEITIFSVIEGRYCAEGWMWKEEWLEDPFILLVEDLQEDKDGNIHGKNNSNR